MYARISIKHCGRSFEDDEEAHTYTWREREERERERLENMLKHFPSNVECSWKDIFAPISGLWC
jgi:hypothetical protein